ncbi:YqaJ viral recombinase family protein [Vreelandella zhanjiangensis]|uniref:YqaJ viral recombinase family protein n=1 Tax=Vreelandella zhanjiangensis TaxID=1121960 RepID=UPI0012DF051D|nr:YqaJ viral recombinase family protein [Halomonas zhanjiangensis]
MQVLTMEQGTPEWLTARLGPVTKSELKVLLVKGKGPGGLSAGANYRGTGRAVSRQRPYPPLAYAGRRCRPLYCDTTGEPKPYEVGIILNHNVGYSPDSLVGINGLLEIKTKLPKFQIEVLLKGKIPEEYIPQCQGGLWVSEREWLDFVSFWPGMPLFIQRAYRDEVMIRTIVDRVEAFHEEME